MCGMGVGVRVVMTAVVATRLGRGDGGRGCAALRAPCRDTKRHHMEPGEGFSSVINRHSRFHHHFHCQSHIVTGVFFCPLYGLHMLECLSS